MDLGTHGSLWIATAPGVEYPRLDGGLRVDVAVVVFSGTGDVLHGPATRPLAKREAL